MNELIYSLLVCFSSLAGLMMFLFYNNLKLNKKERLLAATQKNNEK